MFVAPAFAQTTAPDAAAPETAADEAFTETGSARHEVETGFPPFETSSYPSQLLWLAITFGLFYLFLKRVALPRIAAILEVRRDRIAQDLDQAAHMKEEADAAHAAYEQELAEARRKAGGIAQEAREAAKAQAEAEQRKVEQALRAKLDEAEGRIAEIKASALADVGIIAEETADAIVRELGGAPAGRKALQAAVKAAQ